MDPLTMAAIMAGVGIGKSELIDRPREARQRKAEAERIKWSPWTGMNQPAQIDEAKPFDAAMQGAVAGAQFGKQFGGSEGQSLNVTSEPDMPKKPYGNGNYNLGVQYEPMKFEGYDPALVPQSQTQMEMYQSGYPVSLIPTWTSMPSRQQPDASMIGKPRLGR